MAALTIDDIYFSTAGSVVPGVDTFVYADDDSGRVGDLIAQINNDPDGFQVIWRCRDGSQIPKQHKLKSKEEAMTYVDRVCGQFFQAFWLDEINEALLVQA